MQNHWTVRSIDESRGTCLVMNDYPGQSGGIERRTFTLKEIQQWNPDAVFKIDTAYTLRMLGKKARLQMESGKQKAEEVVSGFLSRLGIRKRE